MERELISIRRSLTVLAVISVFVVTYFARDLILPLILGILLALTLSPINRTMQKLGLPTALSAFLLISVATATILVLAIFVGDVARSWSQDAPRMATELQMKLSGVKETVDAVRDASKQVEELAQAEGNTTPTVAIAQPTLLSTAMTTAASTLTTVLVAVVLAFFLLATGDLFYVKTVEAFPTLREKKLALSTVYGIERNVSNYLLTITIINACLGLAIGLAMWALGLENAYMWGAAGFLLNYLPLVGGLIGTVLVGVHALLYFDSLYYAMLAPAVYQVLTAFEANFITPYLVGRQLKLNVVAVFLTVVLWAWLWGIAGALVAVPFLIVFKVICNNFERLEVFGSFLGGMDDDRAEPETA